MTLKLNPLSLLGAISKFFKGRSKASEIDRELPFTVMLFTLMATSGVAIYDAWRRTSRIKLLPETQKEALEVVRQVEVLGYDPLTVMYQKAEAATSKTYRDFLAGYVSSVKSGAHISSFLRSRLRSVLDAQTAAAVRSIERLGTLVEAYTVMLMVTLCVYILYVVMSATALFEYMDMGAASTSMQPLMAGLMFLTTPFITLIFLAVANLSRRSTLLSTREAFRNALFSGVAVSGFLAASLYLPQMNPIIEVLSLPGLATLCLSAISIPAALAYYRIAKVNFAAEEAMPSFLRDVTESRKIGLSPVKSIIHATKRKAYGRFSDTLKLVRSQIEWGVPLRKIYRSIERQIRSWPVLVYFLVLIETIEYGGSSDALEILSDYAEKKRDIEANKRSTLKPYVVLAFVWSVLISLTTSIVAVTIYVLAQIGTPGSPQVMMSSIQAQVAMFSVSIIFQCWISGFFIGKVSEGCFAAGFKYSAMLALTGFASLVISQNYLGEILGVFSG